MFALSAENEYLNIRIDHCEGGDVTVMETVLLSTL